mmetsp:Transcript_19578/g.25000  ORF Transcript_19578/g.25000 Transcript_19578/m.25000 type:complete len:448 (+) Transcript_19578:181-1524(+)
MALFLKRFNFGVRATFISASRSSLPPLSSITYRSFHGTKKVESPQLSQETIDIVKATAPVIAEHGYSITRNMYGRMLKDPEVAALFNPSHQVEMKGEKAHQPWTLACSVHAYAANIDNLAALSEAVERIAQKHVSLYVLPRHYPIVAENLLWSIKHTLGDAATPEICKAWGEAVAFLADIFIKRETEIREHKRDTVGGWLGWREFVVDRKVVESSEIVSLYLKPKDEGALLDYPAGSYSAIRVEFDGIATQRNYTLSKPAGHGHDGVWRITVKRESPLFEGAPSGRVSGYIHDKVKEGDVLNMGVPCGDFVLKESNKPHVLISGGVGITPVLAMLEDLINKKTKKTIYMINTARCPEAEAMHDVLADYRRKHMNLFIKTLYDEGPDVYPKAPLSMDQLDQMIVDRDCEYYFCGPKGMMKTIYHGLRDHWNIPESQLHYEFFGPTEDL